MISSDNPPAMEIRGMGFWRKENAPILEDITLRIEQAKVLAILGANGSGKTTLLSLLGGRLLPTKGEIFVHGEALTHLSPRALAKQIAFLPQIERLPFNYKVLDFVLLGRAPHVSAFSLPGLEDRARAVKALEDLGLADLAERGSGDISGGEFQMARIARCLSQEAGILLLDEPTSLLDPANAGRIGSMLSALARGGKTIVCATHDVALAGAIADEVILLHERRILAYGSAGGNLSAELLGKTFGVEFKDAKIPSVYGSTAIIG
jgi:iron complex transport system ATP-binding protein